GAEARRIRERKNLKVEYKGRVDLVTEADFAADKIIREKLQSAFPEHYILSEESSAQADAHDLFSGPVWVVDPIDGTTNYAHGHVHVGVSIGYMEDGLAQVGVVHAPFLDETYTAIRGQGAELNGHPIHASTCDALEKALVSTGFPYERDNLGGILFRIERALVHCQDVRRAGAASIDICWIACGKLDAFYENLSPWDVAAGLLVAKEAGVLRGRFSGKNNPLLPDEIDGSDLVVTAPGVYESFLELIRQE
ncbi:MAG: inositol monophosphatase, partial [Bdellovibrionales bacterium]|nr:inositol monophosphatase [Bdellovibrionales bacterium]